MNRSILYIIIGLVILLTAVTAFMAFGKRNGAPNTRSVGEAFKSGSVRGDIFNRSESQNATQSSSVTWEYEGDSWKAKGNAPACSNPIIFESPVDVSKATSILYPGQTRGGDYKPHGGFRFDGATNNLVNVTVPMDAQVVEGSRYIEQGETQYMFDFENACGIRYRFDHLHTLSPAFQDLADKLPAAKQDDSRTTKINPPVAVSAGQPIATAIGFPKTNNAGVDWGVYDLRSANQASKDATWAADHDTQLAHYAVCWFDMLSPGDAARVASLPAGDQQSGKTSDYCK